MNEKMVRHEYTLISSPGVDKALDKWYTPRLDRTLRDIFREVDRMVLPAFYEGQAIGTLHISHLYRKETE